MLKTFPAEIFGGANGSVGRGKKGGVLFAVPRAAGGADTSQSESRGWGVEYTHVRLSLCAAAQILPLIVRTKCARKAVEVGAGGMYSKPKRTFSQKIPPGSAKLDPRISDRKCMSPYI